ncbi:MAG: SRPBCC domain-containing protein [Burkholderiales bacterium]|nr:SRPBCC domain-containing protein [Burkholderiales bacterium]
MKMESKATTVAQPEPLVVSRYYRASRRQVCTAWSAAEHLQHWFCPAGYSVPEATVEYRVGGTFDLCMRSPEGQAHWMRGHYIEIVPDTRLVIDMTVMGDKDTPLFTANTVVTFTDESIGTRMEVTQRYTLLDPMAARMVEGAPMGWAQTLDRLETELKRMQTEPATVRSAVHGTFRIERTYLASPARVYEALTTMEGKSNWFARADGMTLLERTMDVRPQGRERVRGRWANGVVSTFDATYYDLIPNERIVYGYEMHLDTRKISVSLTTFELRPVDKGTQLVMTEQGVFLDGYDDAGSRERGSTFLLDALGAYLQA